MAATFVSNCTISFRVNAYVIKQAALKRQCDGYQDFVGESSKAVLERHQDHWYRMAQQTLIQKYCQAAYALFLTSVYQTSRQFKRHGKFRA